MADTPRRIDIGFQGGQVLPVRVTQEVHDAFRKALSTRARTAGSSCRRRTPTSTSTSRRSSTCGSTPKSTGWASSALRALAALDLRLLRLLRTRGHTPGVERALIRLAQAGENGLLWNAIAVAGGVVSARRRDDYVRAIEIVLRHARSRTRP